MSKGKRRKIESEKQSQRRRTRLNLIKRLKKRLLTHPKDLQALKKLQDYGNNLRNN